MSAIEGQSPKKVTNNRIAGQSNQDQAGGNFSMNGIPLTVVMVAVSVLLELKKDVIH